MKIVKMIAQEKESALKDNVIATMDFPGKIAVLNLVQEIAQGMGSVEMGYVCVMKDFLENFVKKQK
jgi:hypothetical protein